MLAYILNQNKENSCLHMFVVFNNVGPVSYTVSGPTLKKLFVKMKMEPAAFCFENKGCEKYSRPLRQRSTLYSNNESFVILTALP